MNAQRQNHSDTSFLTPQASGSWDKTIRLWNPRTGSVLHVLRAHTGWVQAVSFSADSLRLASVCEDDTVRIWDVVKGECVKTLEVSCKRTAMLLYEDL